MPTANGRSYQTLEGTVDAVNPKGLRLVGEAEWRNYSRWAEAVSPPDRGQRVRMTIDAGGFIRSAQVLEDSTQDGRAALPVAHDATSTRLAVLQAAATFAAGKAVAGTDVTSGDVVKIADVWLRWATTNNQEAE